MAPPPRTSSNLQVLALSGSNARHGLSGRWSAGDTARMYAAATHSGKDDEVLRPEHLPIVESAGSATRLTAQSPAGLLHLQRQAGNRAAGLAVANRLSVQRCGDGCEEEVPVQRDELDQGAQELAGDAGVTDAGAKDSGPKDAGPTDAGAPEAGSSGGTCSEKLNWVPGAAIPVDITADSAVEFSNKIGAALGGNPHMSSSITQDIETENGKISKVNLTLTTSLMVPRFAGGRCTDTERALINRLVAHIKAHEERHRDIARSKLQEAICAVVGQPVKKGQALLNTWICSTMPGAQEALDAVEGTYTFIKDNDGNVIDFKPAGVKQSYKTC